MKKDQDLILIVGKSGVGKNYLCKVLNLNPIPSYTTRPMRINEQNNVEHIFVDTSTFQEHKKNKQIFAATKYCNYYYWTTLQQINNNNYNAYIIDPEGIKYLKDYEFLYGDIKRKYKIVYFRTNIFKRIINMKKRNDKILNIIKRIINDYYAFKEIENQIKSEKCEINVLNI